MDNGWVKLHRKFKQKGYYKRSAYVHLWLHLLLSVNHDKKEFMWNNQTIIVKEGQLITGRKELAFQTGIPETTIERILNFLENEHQIEQQTTTKYRLITIVNWKDYQKVDNKRTTDGQQADTNKNYKNIKKEKNNTNTLVEQSSTDVVKVIDAFEAVNPAFKKWYGNTTQRKAIQSLIDSHGIDKLLTVIALLPKTNGLSYVTTVTTPLQLEDRWATLEAQLKKYKSERSKNIIVKL